MRRTGVALLDQGEAREILKKRCREAGVPVAMIDDLVRLEFEHFGRARRHGLFEQIEEVIAERIEDSGAVLTDPAVQRQAANREAASERRGFQGVLNVYPDHSTP